MIYRVQNLQEVEEIKNYLNLKIIYHAGYIFQLPPDSEGYVVIEEYPTGNQLWYYYHDLTDLNHEHFKNYISWKAFSRQLKLERLKSGVTA